MAHRPKSQPAAPTSPTSPALTARPVVSCGGPKRFASGAARGLFGIVVGLAVGLGLGSGPGGRIPGQAIAAEPSAGTATAIRYQGHLQEAGRPATGTFDLRLTLFRTATDGTPAAGPITNAAVTVSNGLFTTLMDFGADVFQGGAVWLELGVRPGGPDGPFTTLAPRQALSPVPYAIQTLRAERVTGSLELSQIPTNVARLDVAQTFTGPVTFGTNVQVGGTLVAEQLAGNGAGLTNVVATGLAARLAQRFWRVSLPFVAITNAGNPPDPATGKGAIAYPYRIGRYEVNNRQYAAFLNAVAAEDPNRLYHTNMTQDIHGGIVRTGQPGEFAYAPKPGHEHRPVVWVEFPNVLRFCNWLHHGQPSGAQDAATTEDGAYTLTPQGILDNTITRNPGARFWIPNDDEWYKAAYHQPADAGGDPSGYWQFPTRSNDAPFSEEPPGWSNSANACCGNTRRSTDVGSYVDAFSFYGTFDQAGNVEEWTETIIFTTNRRLRGGSWSYNEFYSSSTDFEFDTPDYAADGIGFRVAGALEP